MGLAGFADQRHNACMLRHTHRASDARHGRDGGCALQQFTFSELFRAAQGMDICNHGPRSGTGGMGAVSSGPRLPRRPQTGQSLPVRR